VSIKLSDFDLYRDLLYSKSGLVITPDKTYLLDSRLTPVAKQWGHETLDSMSIALRAFPDPKLVKDIVEAMTTNETSFYRDQKPFGLFEQVVMPALVARRSKGVKKIRIWCAAASTGQEPYSLAMLIKEKAALWKDFSFEIVGTDISEDALDIARAGAYSQFEVQRGLPITHLMKYFKQVEDKWHISDEIKKMITYKYFNLLDDMKIIGSFDIIFCRNVLIYFDEKTKGQVLAKMNPQLANDGFLFLGGAETTIGITDKFKPLENQRGLYVRPDFPGMPAAGAAA
jgi:chemotaxis protein methyltransferase CheR